MTSFSTPSPPIPHSLPPLSQIFAPPTPVTLLASPSLTVSSITRVSWPARFVWDDRRNLAMSTLREIVDRSHTQVSKIEDDLKELLSELDVWSFGPLIVVYICILN
ncbi:hypothetical protein Q3G72_012326 [Acer saccharum]|nr:hypothetical protein Q3G72_012326 [Acer saccharum]